MRLDYYCQISVRDSKGRSLDAKALKRLDGFIDKDENSDFTFHMDPDMAEDLIGEHVRFVMREGHLSARASLHEKRPLTDGDVAEITDYIIGQFLDGYGEDGIEVRKGIKRYKVRFADVVTGPVKVEAKLPKKPRKPKISDEGLRRFQNAVMDGDFDAVKKYVEADNDINAVPKQIETFITTMSALGWAANRHQVEIVKYLLANGADPNVRGRNAKGEIDGPALFYADPEIAELLLHAGADPRAKNADGQSRLEELAATLKWQEDLYDPEDDFEGYKGKEIEELSLKLAKLTELFSQYS